MIGNRVNVQYIACPLCRCGCVLPPSGNFPSCVNNDDIQKALDLPDDDIDILDENAHGECERPNPEATATCSTHIDIKQSIPDMIKQVIGLSRSTTTTQNILTSFGFFLSGIIMLSIATIQVISACTAASLKPYPIMFILGLISFALRLAGCWALQDMRFVTTKNIFLTMNVTDTYISATDEYMWLHLYIYTSVLSSLAHRLLRCHVWYRIEMGFTNFLNIFLNITVGILEVNLIQQLPLAQETVMDPSTCDPALYFVGTAIESFYVIVANAPSWLALNFVYFTYHQKTNADRANRLSAQHTHVCMTLNKVGYLCCTLVLPLLASMAEVPLVSWSSFFMFSPLFPPLL